VGVLWETQEREVRQHLGVGYQFQHSGFSLETNAYAGFYYIEIDDDTPVNRGYTRAETDDGEASSLLELQAQYDFGKNWSIFGGYKLYSANTGFEKLEEDIDFHLTYKDASWLYTGGTLNLKVKHTMYDLDRFNVRPLPILPFDNDTLIQAYATIPLKW
jgi:hypothetical protein